MRRALLTVAALAAGGLIVPATIASAADPQPAPGVHYDDPTYASAATVSVSGTLVTIHSEVGDDQHAVSLPDGRLVPVSLARLGEADERPRSFTGDLVVPAAVEQRAESRGASIDTGDDIDGTSSEGRVVLAAAATATSPLPVETATLGTAPAQRTAQAATATAHRLYVAVITNRGTVESDSSIASKTATMRNYWATESDGLISTFTQPAATVSYASSAAPDTASGCGLNSPSATWNEAAQKFPGVSFGSGGNHLMVVVPDACGDAGAAGIGTVGSSLASGGQTIVTLGDTAVAIGVHELGHNLSLQHANAEQCTSSCSKKEYWDLYSIMGLAVGGGSWTPAALDTAYRLQTGIDDSSEIPTVTASANVRLAGRGTDSGTRGLVVSDPSSGAKYVVDYRSGTGRDATAFYASGRSISSTFVYRPGVVVERVESDKSTTMVTRASGGKYLTSLVAGESMTLGQVTIAVTGATPSVGADVTVTLPGSSAPSNPSNPSNPPTTSNPPAAPATFAPGTPVIYGTARVGGSLAASAGRWSPTPSYVTAQWLADGRAISGANAGRFTITRAQLGKRITVRLTGYRDGYTAAAATSAPTAPVATGRFSSRTVHLTGRAKIGRTLVATTGSWNPQPTFSYRWYANGRVLKSATGRTLKVTKSLRGKRIAVRITASQAGYESASRSSARTASVR